MKRRSFLQLIGLGATATAVPSLAADAVASVVEQPLFEMREYFSWRLDLPRAPWQVVFVYGDVLLYGNAWQWGQLQDRKPTAEDMVRLRKVAALAIKRSMQR